MRRDGAPTPLGLGAGADSVVFWHPLRRGGGRIHPAPIPPGGMKSNGVSCCFRTRSPPVAICRAGAHGQRVLRPRSLGTPGGLSPRFSNTSARDSEGCYCEERSVPVGRLGACRTPNSTLRVGPRRGARGSRVALEAGRMTRKEGGRPYEAGISLRVSPFGRKVQVPCVIA